MRNTICQADLRFLVLIVTIATPLVVPPEASATAQFSRQYNTSCNTCHTAFPKLPLLNRSQKIWNKKQRRVRITVEHTIAQLKTFKVLAERYRHSLQNYNQTFRFVANLVAFRMLQRQT
jgi:hypothetical protein